MRSFKFPNMFKTNSSNIWKSSEYLEATKQNAEILLQTKRGQLFGDPYFGLALESLLFNQNNAILKDMIIDLIYTQIALFLPQVKVKRSDIEVIQDEQKGKLYCRFSGINQIDYKYDTFNLLLYRESDE